MSASTLPTGPGPYAATIAGLGGLPTIGVDVPITAVFLAIFVLAAVTHQAILQINRRRGHKFLFNGALFGFCMARIVACVLRIVWATRPESVQVAIAATVFFNAGVLILILVNLIFSQRLLRSMHPKFGWSKPMHFVFIIFYATIPLALIAQITTIVQQSYTLQQTIIEKDHVVQRVMSTYFVAASFMPIVITIASLLCNPKLQNFGSGGLQSKVIILLSASTLICLGASFRAGTGYLPRPRDDPAWYHSRACYYCFNFVIEVFVVYMYAIVRVDKRFHVPNGSSKVKSYRDVVGNNEKYEVRAGDPDVMTNEDDDEFHGEFRVKDEKRKQERDIVEIA